jgi:hypothetical protein
MRPALAMSLALAVARRGRVPAARAAWFYTTKTQSCRSKAAGQRFQFSRDPPGSYVKMRAED